VAGSRKGVKTPATQQAKFSLSSHLGVGLNPQSRCKLTERRGGMDEKG